MTVYVHASGSSGRQWKRWVEALPGVAPDLLGSGSNPTWDGPFDLQLDVDLVVHHCGTGPVDLVGHSYGGVLSLLVALQKPALVRTVTVYEPPLFGLLVDGSDRDRALFGSLPLGLSDPAVAGTESWLATFVDWWNGPGAWDALAEPVRAEFVRVGDKVAGEVIGLQRDRHTLADFAKLRCPVLVLRGDRTPAPVAKALDRLGTLPNVRTERIENAGHLAPVQSPERLIPLVEAFLHSQVS